MNFLTKTYYNWSLSTKMSTYSPNELFDTLDKYSKYTQIEAQEADEYSFDAKEDIVAVRSKNDENCDIFYKNLHIHRYNTPTDKFVKIELKHNDESWRTGKKGAAYDVVNPLNEVMEVFFWFDTMVKGRLKYTNYNYAHGAWDEYVYRTLSEIEKIAYSFTKEAKFAKAYKKEQQKEAVLEEQAEKTDNEPQETDKEPKLAEKAKYVLSDDKEQVARIQKGIALKKEKFGEGYCPCVVSSAHSEDTICPCKEYRLTGICHCKMYKE